VWTSKNSFFTWKSSVVALFSFERKWAPHSQIFLIEPAAAARNITTLKLLQNHRRHLGLNTAFKPLIMHFIVSAKV
jgi:hypothetical protein